MILLPREVQSLSFFLIGAILGVGFYANFSTLAPKGCKYDNNLGRNSLVKSGRTIAQIVPQKQQLSPKIPLKAIQSSKPIFQDIPKDLSDIKTYYGMDCSWNCQSFIRPLRILGWTKLNSPDNALLVFTTRKMSEKNEVKLNSWQRHNHLPQSDNFLLKDNFFDGLISYQNLHGAKKELDFIPETYRLHNAKELESFRRILKDEGAVPWVSWEPSMRTTYISTKHEIQKFIDTSNPVRKRYMTRYVCNQMTYSNGIPFLIRVFWFVASLDPLLVFYQDGYVRIGYNQTFPNKMKVDDEKISFDDFGIFLEKEQRKLRKNNKLSDEDNNRINPLDHVRNQIKSSLVTMVDVFRTSAFDSPSNNNTNVDAFELFATDFVLDNDFNVHMMFPTYSDTEPNADKHYDFILEDYYFLLEKVHELYYATIQILTEIWEKQQQQTESILPLSNTGKYQLIYALDHRRPEEEWKFSYKSPRHKIKRNKIAPFRRPNHKCWIKFISIKKQRGKAIIPFYLNIFGKKK